MMKKKTGTVASSIFLVSVLISSLVGCTSDSQPAPNASALPDTAVVTIEGTPQDVLDAGTLEVVVPEDFAPGSFINTAGEIVGWEIELAAMIAERLGVSVSTTMLPFEQILPAVASGQADISLASMFDTDERERVVNFVNYFRGGTGWGTSINSQFNPVDPCGGRVGGIDGTSQLTDFLVRKSIDCVNSGAEPLDIVSFASAADAAEAVKVGALDAFVADSPIVSYQVDSSKGQLRVAGPPEQIQPYGIAVAKDRQDLLVAVQAAAESLIADGSYARLLGKWGVERGALNKTGINRVFSE